MRALKKRQAGKSGTAHLRNANPRTDNDPNKDETELPLTDYISLPELLRDYIAFQSGEISDIVGEEEETSMSKVYDEVQREMKK